MILFETENPAALLRAFDDAIAKGDQAGGITTWLKVDSDYTHASAQWHRKAYLEPSISAHALIFNIIKNQGTNITVPVYGFYHGHLMETFLNHFDLMFSSVACTPLCSGGDLCAAA